MPHHADIFALRALPLLLIDADYVYLRAHIRHHDHPDADTPRRAATLMPSSLRRFRCPLLSLMLPRHA